jgi:predicted transcriptional regulator
MSNQIGQKETRSTSSTKSTKINVVVSTELDNQLETLMGKLDTKKSVIVRRALEEFIARNA